VFQFEEAGGKGQKEKVVFFTCVPLPFDSANRKMPRTDPHGVISINFLHDETKTIQV